MKEYVRTTSEFKEAVDAFNKVLLSQYLTDKYFEVTGEKMFFATGDHINLNATKGHISAPYEKSIQSILDQMLLDTVEHNPKFVQVKFEDCAIWFYFN